MSRRGSFVRFVGSVLCITFRCKLFSRDNVAREGSLSQVVVARTKCWSQGIAFHWTRLVTYTNDSVYYLP